MRAGEVGVARASKPEPEARNNVRLVLVRAAETAARTRFIGAAMAAAFGVFSRLHVRDLHLRLLRG